MKSKRKKGILGLAAASLIGAGVSALGNVASSLISANAEKKANEARIKQEKEANALAQANNMQQIYNNRDYIDDKTNSVRLNTINSNQLRCGGSVIYRNRFCSGGRFKRR